ncbi:Folylpolyglutamate synthase-like protein [Emericellopsis cladophorae]|uniref:Folylpolyglutamate synthase n=1 Tax=Emericellopsis cladophorae TaxID=2686198 RepID=A0A9P9Y4Q7_9HYPO|nr:Folylpolyglutamate synthase-like protein [Emericellopsis cladophorae]KAI6783310.1 Folylpolyglutamate synthase-like protein [Emericellopsis cladophorae]
MSTAGRTYNDAIDALNTLQTPHDIIEQRRKAGIRPDASSIKEMKVYLDRIGYKLSDLTRLNIVHVAGTKGKGSTCAFVDAILGEHRRMHGSPRKTGLFISPHLIAVRERIRINSEPISEELFAKYFFDVWDRLEKSPGAVDEAVPQGSKPIYARYLTLMSWHVFLQEGIDVAVYETGIGGEFDATNIVENPVASGITSLGIDHVFALGDTVDKIAWHKAGIMKHGSPAFTIHQSEDAAVVLTNRALEKSVDLKVLKVDPRLQGVRVRPDALFQKKNATLGIALAETVLRKLGSSDVDGTSLAKTFIDGLEGVIFRGRCEVKEEERVIWHVDGAHTADSLKVAAKWFTEEVDGRTGPRALIFNQQGRTEAVDFLESIHSAAKREGKPTFDLVLFCTNVTYIKTGYKRDFVNHQADAREVHDMVVQHRFEEKWTAMEPTAKVRVVPTIEEAIEQVRAQGSGLDQNVKVDALVTGSLHLVGGALGMLEQADAL